MKIRKKRRGVALNPRRSVMLRGHNDWRAYEGFALVRLLNRILNADLAAGTDAHALDVARGLS